MPIEIRELVIRARVEPQAAPREPASEARRAADAQWREELVQACVQEVLRILEDKRER